MDNRAIPEKSLGEVKEIRAMIPPEGCDREVQAALYKKVKERIGTLTNDAIAQLALMHGHELAMRVLLTRLWLSSFSNLSELFRLLDVYLTRTSAPKDLYEIIISAIIRAARFAPQSEIIAIAHDFKSSRMMRDTAIYYLIAEVRKDGKELLTKISETER